MKNLANLFLFLLLGMTINIMVGLDDMVIVATLCAIITACILYLYPTWKYRLFIIIGYLLLCCHYPSFMAYLPLLYMQCAQRKSYAYNLLFLFPFLFYLKAETLVSTVLLLLFTLLAYYIKLQNDESIRMQEDLRKQRDTSKEVSILLSEKNKNLLITQEQEIHIATLNERNRIAREIHDHVGHLLSSALLQIGAIQAISHEEVLQEPLQNLRETLSQGMDNVRNSVHDLHDDAMDLEVLLQNLIRSFSFCEVQLEYTLLHSLPDKAVYHVAAILKECMNNTMKHSNATLLTITLREQPAFYQLIIKDNGTHIPTVSKRGIGIQNIEERVIALHGYLNIETTHGFQVFITIPKEKEIVA